MESRAGARLDRSSSRLGFAGDAAHHWSLRHHGRFAPDIAEVLVQIVKRASIRDHNAEVRRWNQYRPPPVTEWLPLSEARPTDLARPDDFIHSPLADYTDQLMILLNSPEHEITMAGRRQSSWDALRRLPWCSCCSCATSYGRAIR